MTDLTLEELAALQDEVDRDDTPVVELSHPNFDALLAMARELVRLKSALEFLDVEHSATLHTLLPNMRNGVIRDLNDENVLKVAAGLGWPDPLPPSERKGEG